MARTARTHSDSGVYHAILRGVNKQQIFECTEDYQRFLNILRTLTVQEQDESGHRSKPNCVVYAYCLMGNHVHHLIKESSETLAQIMKRISSTYVYYYRRKGDLFQYLLDRNESGSCPLTLDHGICSVDCFKKNGEIYVIEMNCRISGHYPLAYLAGFNYPQLVIDWMYGKETNPELIKFETDLYIIKDLVPTILRKGNDGEPLA